MQSSESIKTTDSVSCIVLFGRTMRDTVRKETGIGLTGYRILAYLGQHPQGKTPGSIAETLGLSSGTTSLALAELRKRSLVTDVANDANASSTIVRRTASGQRAARACDEALSAAYDEFFAPLGEKLRADLLAGSLVTTSHIGVTRMEENSYFTQYSVLIGFLRNEQHFMNVTRRFGLGLGEYRVLLALYEHPSANSHARLRTMLVAHKSELSSWCKSLAGRGLIASAPTSLDKRGKAFSLTAAGSQLVERVNDAIDIREVRPVQPGEIDLYNGMFRIVMEHIRMRR